MIISLIQHNPTIAAVDANVDHLTNLIKLAASGKPDAIVLPELCITGYPPRDLLNREDLIDKNLKARDYLVSLTKDFPSTLIFGYVERNNEVGAKKLFNAVCVAKNGEVI